MTHDRKELTANAMSYLSENPCLMLEDVSRKLGANRQTLETAMRCQAGVSFRECKQVIRLHKSLSLLTDENFTIKQVASMMGYSSPICFTRFIKNHTGKTPGEIKKEKNRH